MHDRQVEQKCSDCRRSVFCISATVVDALSDSKEQPAVPSYRLRWAVVRVGLVHEGQRHTWCLQQHSGSGLDLQLRAHMRITQCMYAIRRLICTPLRLD